VTDFQPLTHAQIVALADKAKQAVLTGKIRAVKTTAHFDSTARTIVAG
jgi:hypothetical protein